MIKEEVEVNESVTETRDLATRKCDSFGNYEIYRQGGGKKPAELDGIYTGPMKAEQVLESYLETQGILNEAKKIKEEMRTIHPLDHTTYDDDLV